MLEQQKQQQTQNYQHHQCEYFQGLRQKLLNHGDEFTERARQKIEEEIDDGRLPIPNNPELINSSIKKITHQIHRKSADFHKQLLKLNLTIKRNTHSARGLSARSDLTSHKNQALVTQQQMKQYWEEQKQASKRLRKLKQEKEKVQHKKQEISKNKELTQLRQEAQKLKIEQQRLKLIQKQKRQHIMKSMEQIQKRKQFRSRLLQQSRLRSTSSLPKYLEMKRKFDDSEKNFNQIKNLRYKNWSKNRYLQNDPIKIKQHQNQYVSKNKERIFSKRRVKTQERLTNHSSKFKFTGDEERKSLLEERRHKMLEFDKNITRKIRLKTNIEKKIEMEIKKDKTNNPQKYNFLGQKLLNDYQIYREFDNFKLNIDRNNLGNQYLLESKVQVKDSRIKTNPSQEVYSERKKYKNYLIQARKNIDFKRHNELDPLKKKYPDKNQLIEALQNKSEQHSQKAMQKIKKLRLIASYENTIKAEAQIDEDFIGAIKARLACLELKQQDK